MDTVNNAANAISETMNWNLKFLIFSFMLPSPVLIRRVLYTFMLQIINHSVKLTLPHFLEPISISQKLYNCGAYSIVSVNECSAIPGLSKRVVTVTAQCPYLRAVI